MSRPTSRQHPATSRFDYGPPQLKYAKKIAEAQKIDIRGTLEIARECGIDVSTEEALKAFHYLLRWKPARSLETPTFTTAC